MWRNDGYWNSYGIHIPIHQILTIHNLSSNSSYNNISSAFLFVVCNNTAPWLKRILIPENMYLSKQYPQLYLVMLTILCSRWVCWYNSGYDSFGCNSLVSSVKNQRPKASSQTLQARLRRSKALCEYVFSTFPRSSRHCAILRSNQNYHVITVL